MVCTCVRGGVGCEDLDVQKSSVFSLRCARKAYKLQAQDEADVLRWIEKISSLYYGKLQSRKGTAAASRASPVAAGGRARSGTVR
jgi:hypothetical protein